MKQKPPYYELDHETRRLVELVAHWARELESVQQRPNPDMTNVINTVCERLGIVIDDEPQEPAEVVPLRPFRVILSNKSETEDEPG
jgi:hypothetical protein